MSNAPRVQAVVIPLLRAALDNDVTVSSWIPDVDDRSFPIVNVRALGGRDSGWYAQLKLPVVEITAYGNETLEATELLMDDALNAIEDAVYKQTDVPGVGHLHSMFITFAPGQFDSPYDDTWRVQALIQLGVRPSA